MPLSGGFILAAALVSDPLLAAVLMAMAAACADLCLSPSWALCHDVGGEAAGTVTGAMNTFGNLGGAISPIVVGYSVELWGSWSTPLVITAGVYVLGGVLTLLANPHKRLAFRQISPSALELSESPVRPA
jgi:nitrate/nitrite transporter NarK